MKSKSLSLLALAALVSTQALASSSASAQMGEWRLQDESVVRFMCEGPGIDEPSRGRFGAVSARAMFDPSNMSEIRGALEVVLASIRTERAGWDSMFRSAPFLALDDHPRALFELFEVRRVRALTSGWQPVELVGRLTVKGVSKDIVVPGRIRHLAAEGDSPERVELLAIFSMKWSDHDIAVPDGWTREFAGDGARVRMHLVFARS